MPLEKRKKEQKVRNGTWFMYRITCNSDETIKDILGDMDTIVCREISREGVQHYHSIYKDRRTTIEGRLKRHGLVGNKHRAYTRLYEDTQEEWNHCVNYICKGMYHGYSETNPCIIINTINADVKKHHDNYWLQRGALIEDIAESLGVKENPPHNSSNPKVTENVLAQIYMSISDKRLAQKWNKLECCQHVRSWYQRCRKPLNRHYCIALTDSLFEALADTREEFIKRTAMIAYSYYANDPTVSEHDYKLAMRNNDVIRYTWDDIEKEESGEIL